MMDEVYRLQFPSINDNISLNPNLVHSESVGDGNGIISININGGHNHQLHLLTQTQKNRQGLMEMSDVIIKAQIANHPLYPNLLSAYIDCRKVGAPPEMLSLLDEISKENEAIFTCTDIGTDPELDRFMESYCEVLEKYKEEVSKPFDEATNFLSTIQSQLTHLCNQTLPSTTYYYSPPPDNGGEGFSCGEMAASRSQECNNDGRLKQMLMHKYSGYLSSLRKEFLKKRKKGKLPSEAIAALLEWWNTHYRWPYPTEEEKSGLSEKTGLDQKQINNWFINQRKRHWRPSEDMRFALMQDVGSMSFDATGGTGGIGI